MKRLFLLICLVSACAANVFAQLSVTEMKVENLHNPLGIDVPKPRFSWQLQSDERGCVQKSYTIRVSTASGTEVWNSGVVESALQYGIVYDGTMLESQSAYVWTVTVNTTDGASASASATFETAFMTPSEWTARWIHAEGHHQTLEPLVITFDTPITCRYLRLNITQLGLRANSDSGYSFAQLCEMEIYSGSNNVARTATFSASNSWTLPNYGWDLSYINDGRTDGTGNNGWTTTQNPSVPITVTADLGELQTIDRVLLYPRQDDHAVGQADNIAANFPAAFTLQTSSTGRNYAVAYTYETAPTPKVPYFGRNIDVPEDKAVVRARIYATALGVFTMRLNGQPVTDAVLEPGESEYEKTILYSTYDVTSLLRGGSNTLVAQVAGGIYDIDYLDGRFSKGEVRNNGKTALLAELLIEYADGTRQRIVTDTESWRWAASPTSGSNWWGGEDYDARRRIDLVSPDLTTWNPVEEITPHFSSPHSGVSGHGTLRSRMYEPLRVVEEWQAVNVKTISSGGYTLRMIDFGRNFAGQYRFRLKGKAGQTISLRCGESLNPDGSVYMENYYTGPSDTYEVYTFSGDEDGEEWGPEFMYHGFRYLQIIGLDEEPRPENFTALRIRSDMSAISEVSTSNALINDIHTICRDAIASQLYNTITDCPHREKLGWLDVPNEMYVSLNSNFDMQNFYKKVVLDCFDAQQPDGHVPSVAPYYMNVYGDDVNWGGAAILVPYRNWRYYGDTTLMQTYYPQMKQLVQHFAANTTGYIINDTFSALSDWGQETAGVSPMVPTGFTETATYYYILCAMAEMAAQLGQTADAATYKDLSDKVKNAFNAKYYNPATSIYTSISGGGGRQSEQAMPLYYGLVPKGDEAKVAALLAQAVKNDGYKVKAGEIALKTVFMSLAQYGYNDIVWQMANQTDCPSYGYWVRQGYTTTPEYWDVGPFSQNHCMMDHIEEWFFTQLAGIQNTGTAFDRFLIAPYFPSDLQASDITTSCTYGPIRSAWTRTTDGCKYMFSVPAGTEATIVVPCPSEHQLTEDGTALQAGVGGVRSISYDQQTGTCTVVCGSGNYDFQIGSESVVDAVDDASEVHRQSTISTWYDVHGRPARSLAHSGIYIQDGKKTLVK